MSWNPGRDGELLVGTLDELERDIALVVQAAGAASGKLSFSGAEPHREEQGQYFVRVRVLQDTDPMSRSSLRDTG